MAPYAKTAKAVPVNAPVLGHITFTVTRKESAPIYGIDGGLFTYGAVLDQHFRDFYAEPENDGAMLTEFAVELTDDAQRNLRDSIQKGHYL